MSEANIIAAEHQRRHSNRDAIAEYLKAHQAQWIDAGTLAELGGALAWRTRLSDCRLKLGMYIENMQERDFNGDGTLNVRSFYRYLAHAPIGEPADQPMREVTLFNLSDRQERR